MSLTFEQLVEIEEVVTSKGWIGKRNRNGSELLDLIFRLFELTKHPDEFSLLKYLLSKYFLCTNYDDYCFQIAQNIEGTFAGERVVIIPVYDERMKIKSGHSVAYDLTSFLNEEKFTEFKVLESLDALKPHINEFNILVVDDFIGTGTQFRSFSRRCISKYEINPKQIYLYSIVMMTQARKRINGFCYNSYSCMEFDRALSEDVELNTMMPAVNVYEKIEHLAVVGKQYRRGYLKSEALVTMKKTPNNTLPIFWAKSDATGADWPAIFPRK